MKYAFLRNRRGVCRIGWEPWWTETLAVTAPYPRHLPHCRVGWEVEGVLRPTQFLAEMALPPRKVFIIAEISASFPLTRPEEGDGKGFYAPEAYSIVLVINQESMLIDPIQWEVFKKALLTWAERSCPNLSIPELTDNLFNERIPLHHSPRARHIIDSPPSGIYHFFDHGVKPRFETNHLISCGIPIEEAKLINKLNAHDRNLSMVGILPNQIRRLQKNRDEGDKTFEELSKELFWQGYNIWNKRKKLMSKFWTEIAPNDWKLYDGKGKNEKSNRKVKTEKKPYPCQNPFHFLKRHCDLSQKLPTPVLLKKEKQ